MNRNIITQARTWLGTRFHHQGRLKASAHHHGGVDCIGLVLGVLGELQLCDVNGVPYSQHDVPGYARVPDGVMLQTTLEKHLQTVALHDIQPGDILLFRFDQNPQHVGIASDYGDELGLIHCYAQVRQVVEHHLDATWRNRLVAVYRVYR